MSPVENTAASTVLNLRIREFGKVMAQKCSIWVRCNWLIDIKYPIDVVIYVIYKDRV
jgi:hypothetical protein